MRKWFYFFLTLMFLNTNCSNTPKEISEEKTELSHEAKTIILKKYEEATQILSVKHNIPDDKARLITMEYIKIYVPHIYMMVSGVEDNRLAEKIIKPDEELTDFIQRLAQSTGQPNDIVASYVFDLKLFLKSKSD